MRLSVPATFGCGFFGHLVQWFYPRTSSVNLVHGYSPNYMSSQRTTTHDHVSSDESIVPKTYGTRLPKIWFTQRVRISLFSQAMITVQLEWEGRILVTPKHHTRKRLEYTKARGSQYVMRNASFQIVVASVFRETLFRPGIEELQWQKKYLRSRWAPQKEVKKYWKKWKPRKK